MEQIDPKKVRERKILDLIYTGRRVSRVISSECPDFILHGENGILFGVEITELYYSQTDARLERILQYSSELLGGGNFRHKDDVRQITVGKIDILNKADEVIYSQVDAIIKELPTPAECALHLGALVRSKAKKLAQSQEVFSHVNLIVHDRTNILKHISREDFFLIYFLPDLRVAIAEAPFREIYFLTKMNEETGFIPLKMLLLLAEVYFFNAVYSSMANDLQSLETEPELEVFASYLAGKVQGPVLFRRAEDGLEVIFGDSGFFLAPEGRVAIRMYQDGIYPDDARHIDSELARRLGPGFMAALDEHWTANTFVTPLLFSSGRFMAERI